MKKIIIAAIVATMFAGSAVATGNDHGKPDGGKPQASPVNQTVSAKQLARAEAKAQARASARSSAAATGGSGTGGNAEATGGTATANGGQVIVSNGGTGSGLTGRMVPDVSATSPITSTSCRNGINAGGSGNGWGGLVGFFSEDDLCEWRLLEQNYRATGDIEKANAIRSGMTAQRCEKLNPKEREMFGDLCQKPPAQEIQNVAFSSAG